jgi:MerR family transcriptional regulator, redox-sensitive transcriptional activator SoxR
MKVLLTVSGVTRRSGAAASALRFYESRGLIRSVRAGGAPERQRRIESPWAHALAAAAGN